MINFVFYVPSEHKEVVKTACFNAGAGRYQNYGNACWEVEGTGQFVPLSSATPHIGVRGKLERVAEFRVEMIVRDEDYSLMLQAFLASHPYEQPAYVAYKLYECEMT